MMDEPGQADGERGKADVHAEYVRWAFIQAPVPVAILYEPGHVIALVNDAMNAAWSRSPAIVGRPLAEAVPEAIEWFGELLDRVIATGDPYVGREVPFRTEALADGTTAARYANFILAPIRNTAGTVACVLVIGEDVTEEIRARDEMRRLRAQAEAASQAKDQFLAMLGHELRNPLAPIATALELLHMRGVTGRELDVLERQVGHLTRLVDDLLDVSRATRGKLELHPRDVELADLVAEAIEVASPLLEQRRDRIAVDVAPHGLAVHVDRERMIQVVANLLTNAAKYSDPASLVEIHGDRHDHTIRLSVRDHGYGIAPDMLEHVFEQFVQQPQTLDRAHGGLGLGLTIVRNLVELHGGTVTAASEGVGHGSEFTIELPASYNARRLSERARDPARGDGARAEPQARRPLRILVVDDNEDAAATLAEVLEHGGHELAVAHDGPAALRTAAAFRPEVALLDLGLPVMDGYELAERLRTQDGADHRLHLVAVTGYGQDSDRERSAHAGFERHFVKPVDFTELANLIDALASR
jgi:signal transduction histidine kinase/ActR/RegA family two-component response regulator